MTLREAITAFLGDYRKQAPEPDPAARALELMRDHFDRAGAVELADVTAQRLRDFLSRRCIEERVFAAGPSLSIEASERFIRWADETAGASLSDECLPVLAELRLTLPRAIEITEALTAHLSGRGGAFTFPEFLTSFEAGGRSEYDVDAPADVGALEGYFRVLGADGPRVEAEDLLSGQRVWPIIFPEEIARLIEPGYIINLELILTEYGWQVSGCGFAYPPGTDV